MKAAEDKNKELDNAPRHETFNENSISTEQNLIVE